MLRSDVLESTLSILGMGHFHPENVIDNAFLQSLNIETDEAWILERVGIRQRRTVLPLEYIFKTKNLDIQQAHEVSLYSNAQTGARAARMAMDRAKITPNEIGMVIAGGCSPQYTIPAEACMIAAELGVTAPSFDINSACSSFAAQLNYINSLKIEGSPDYILIVNAENNTRTVDYSDRRTAVLWGDGTSAAVVSLKQKGRLKVKSTLLESDPSGYGKVKIPVGKHFWQDGSAVQGFAIRRSVQTIQRLRQSASTNPAQLKMIGHQANLLMLNSVCERSEILPVNHWSNVVEFGNTGASGAPTVLSQNWDQLQSGQEIALAVVGSGLTWGGALFEVQES